MGSGVGEDGVDLVRDGGDQPAQEVARRAARHLLMQPNEGELRGSIDCAKQVELAFCGSDFGDVEMKIANWIGLNLRLAETSPSTCGSRGPMALQRRASPSHRIVESVA